MDELGKIEREMARKLALEQLRTLGDKADAVAGFTYVLARQLDTLADELYKHEDPDAVVSVIQSIQTSNAYARDILQEAGNLVDAISKFVGDVGS